MAKITNHATVQAKTGNTATSVQVGTIVYNTWGYEQTNVDFYEVVNSSRCFVWLQQLSAKKTETLSMQGTTVPVPGTRAGKSVSTKSTSPMKAVRPSTLNMAPVPFGKANRNGSHPMHERCRPLEIVSRASPVYGGVRGFH